MTDRERFDGKCPYTDKPCDDWECESGRASNAKQARNWSYCPYCGIKMEEMK